MSRNPKPLAWRTVLCAVAVPVAACDDGVGTMPRDHRTSLQTQFPVRPNPSAFESASAESRAEAKRAAIDAILQKVPAEDRATMRKLLERPPGVAGGFVSSNDPEIARHLAVLQSLLEVQSAEWQGEPEATRRDEKPDGVEVPVMVALVADLGSPSVRATVVRRPTDGGRPLLLVRESDATTTDLGRGLRAAALSVQRYGAAPPKEIEMQFREFRGTAKTNDPSTQALLNLVRSSPVQSIAGVGSVRAAAIFTSLTAPTSR